MINQNQLQKKIDKQFGRHNMFLQKIEDDNFIKVHGVSFDGEGKRLMNFLKELGFKKADQSLLDKHRCKIFNYSNPETVYGFVYEPEKFEWTVEN